MKTPLSPLEKIERVFRPLMSLCIRNSLKIQDITIALKMALLRAASDELQAQGVEKSFSKLSVMTGLQRTDIKRLQNTQPQPVSEKSLLVRIVGQWSTDRRYLDDEGRPRTLSFETKQSEFAQMVASVSKELNHYAVLFELERAKIVKKTPDGASLVSPAYVTTIDESDSIRMLSSDLTDLINCVDQNTSNTPTVPNLHLKMHYDNISQEDLEKIRTWLVEEGSRFMHRAQSFVSQFDRDINPSLVGKPCGARVVLGMFSLSERDPQEQGDGDRANTTLALRS